MGRPNLQSWWNCTKLWCLIHTTFAVEDRNDSRQPLITYGNYHWTNLQYIVDRLLTNWIRNLKTTLDCTLRQNHRYFGQQFQCIETLMASHVNNTRQAIIERVWCFYICLAISHYVLLRNYEIYYSRVKIDFKTETN